MESLIERSVAPERRRRAAKWHQRIVGSSSALTFTVAQVAPMIFISAAFLLRGGELANLTLGGVPLVTLLAASSIVVPLASQAFAGVVFAAVGSIDRRDLPSVAAAFLRSLPRSVAWGVPFAALLAAAVIAALRLDAAGAAAYAAYLSVNLLFALALTFAYVLSSARIIVVSWGIFALCLAIAPDAWWAPAVVGSVVGLAAAAAIARSQSGPSTRPTWAESGMGAVRATAGGLPLWSLPLLVFLSDPVRTPVGVLFFGMLPVLLLYQVYFSLIARPLWTDLDVFRRRLEKTPLADGQIADGALRRSAARGSRVLLVGIALGAVLVALFIAGGVGAPELLAPLFLATAAGMVLVVEVTRHSMIAGDTALYATAAVGPIAFALGWWASGTTLALLAFAVACAIAAALVAARNAQVWRDAAYHLFWRRAFDQ